MQEILTIAVNNGIGVACAAAVLMFAWFRETRTIPGMIAAFTKSQEAQQKAFTEVQALTAASFESRNDKLLAAFTEAVREQRAVDERHHGENRDRLDKNTSEIRELRHDVREVSNQIGLRKAVEEARAKRAQPPEG